MSTYFKQIEIKKSQATTKCGKSIDRSLRNRFNLKISTLYLLSFSRNGQNSICIGIGINKLFFVFVQVSETLGFFKSGTIIGGIILDTCYYFVLLTLFVGVQEQVFSNTCYYTFLFVIFE